jgi:hypothetical protein
LNLILDVINNGSWSIEEHNRYTEALEQHGKKWSEVAKYVETRSSAQCRSHHQKFEKKLTDTGFVERKYIQHFLNRKKLSILKQRVPCYTRMRADLTNLSSNLDKKMKKLVEKGNHGWKNSTISLFTEDKSCECLKIDYTLLEMLQEYTDMTKSPCKKQSEFPLVLDKKTFLFLTLQMLQAQLNSTATPKTITQNQLFNQNQSQLQNQLQNEIQNEIQNELQNHTQNHAQHLNENLTHDKNGSVFEESLQFGDLSRSHFCEHENFNPDTVIHSRKNDRIDYECNESLNENCLLKEVDESSILNGFVNLECSNSTLSHTPDTVKDYAYLNSISSIKAFSNNHQFANSTSPPPFNYSLH